MSATVSAPLGKRLPLPGQAPHLDELLTAFLDYVKERGLELYSAQEEAILEVFEDHNVILNTPTGSGKSLVALAVCFKALSERRTAFYTAPIKALVTEKFFELCEVLGPKNVGMMTGDATVNRDAPVICCTAEILSNLALREGTEANVDWVVMDEFHYYADRDRGGAWQVPLITLTESRFLLMSATLGDTAFFVEELEKTTGAVCTLVRSTERPVPLDFEYGEKPLQRTVEKLSEEQRLPVYIVHFSQRAASEQAQKLSSLDLCSREDKERIKKELIGFRFETPFGKELARFLRHGVGVHHAGMLPKYRRLCERLAQQGLLRIICGTDTLGVGVNVPIRTVLFTQLCKYDGKNTTLLSVREFHQIAGRAGRRGFDSRGTVVVQAPEHEIENLELKAKIAADPKKAKKLRPKPPPDRGYKPWNKQTLERLIDAPPEPLVSQLSIDHGMVLNVLASEGGCRRGKRLVLSSHESPRQRRRLLRQGISLLRSLLNSEIVVVDGGRARVNEGLQRDFSLDQALGLYAVEAIDVLDREAPNYALSLLSVVEAILESPQVILQKQVDELKTRRMAELKQAGVEYEERLEELAKIEHPKPEAEFIYETFGIFSKQHPWVAAQNIKPKSIARDMHEQAASFNDYVKEYGLARAEGVLLRYLTDCYKALLHTVPESAKTEAVFDLEEWLRAELRRVDASLIEEWERLEALAQGRSLEAVLTEAPAPAQDITTNKRAFAISIKNACFRVVTCLSRGDLDRALDVLKSVAPDDVTFAVDGAGEPWTDRRLAAALAPYWERYDALVLDADARSAARVTLVTTDNGNIQVRQALSDPEGELEWALYFEVDVAACRTQDRLRMTLLRVGEG
jgi:superfamily II RNA helicase